MILILLVFIKIKKISIINKSNFYIAFSQLILLILICQGRGDYYACPIILFTYLASKFDQNNKLSLLNSYNYFLNFTILFQSIFLIIFLCISISQSIYSLLDYEDSMKKISYGYSSSLLINKSIDGNIFHNIGRDARFYYPENYIDRDNFNSCLLKNNQDNCLKKYKINQIIAQLDYLINKNKFNFKEELVTKGSRNPFNRKEEILEICERKINE